MFYVKLNNQGDIEQYPYTLTDLKRAHRNVSWPKNITAETAAAYNVFPVISTEEPAEDYRKNRERTAVLIDGNWFEQWTEVDASVEEIAERTAAKANDVRADRNKRLAETDWTQSRDVTLDNDADWIAYRQALRDITSQEGFPHDVTWPEKP